MPFDETSMRLTGSQREVQAYLEYRALPFVFASDLYGSAIWQDALKRGEDYVYGKRSVSAYEHRPQFELYNLEKDPDELHNLAEDGGHRDTLASLKRKLQQFQKRTGDPWILKWQHE
jgi:N-sulfoglucosamine sulfohydrolase